MILKTREIQDFAEIEEIINTAQVCHLGMADGDKPYVLPMNFGYENKTVYLHGAPEGKKIEVLEKNKNVCITFDIDHILKFRDEHVACSYSMRYRSVILFGKAVFIDDYDEKIKCMNIIMRKYSGKDFTYNAPAIKNIKVWKVEIEEITGKKYV